MLPTPSSIVVTCRDRHHHNSLSQVDNPLLEWVGAGSPVCEEQAETDGLEDTGNGTDGDRVERSLLGDDLGDDLLYISQLYKMPFCRNEHTEGAAEAKKTKLPRYAAPL